MTNSTIKTRVKAFGKRLLDTARDEYYATPEARIDTIFGGGSEYFVRLRAAKNEWDKSDSKARQEFQEYLKENYGIQMKFEESGISIGYEVLDEQKHTIFLLKFSG
jgi:hypothetical protein